VRVRPLLLPFALCARLVFAGPAASPALASGLETATAPARGVRPALPSFAGWQKSSSQVLAAPPWGLPPNDAAAMKDYGLDFIEIATFTRGSEILHAQAFYFGDATGAFGAFTWYRPRYFHTFDLNQPRAQAASGGTHVLFSRGNWLLRIDAPELTAMTGSEMRQLAAALPAVGPDTLPNLPLFLPTGHYVENSLLFAEGPADLQGRESWLDPTKIGFSDGAEAAMASYDIGDPNAELVVVEYPTPQIAAQFAAQFAHAGGGIEVRRSGVLLGLLHDARQPDGAKLLNGINFDAYVTWNEPAPTSASEFAHFMMTIFVFIGLLLAVAVVLGLWMGWFRRLLIRLFPKRFQRLGPGDDFIHLDLGPTPPFGGGRNP
jgi:hypothetical protein